MRGQTNRRQFVQQTALAGIGFWVAGGLRADEEKKSDKPNIACIGVGGKGGSDTSQAGKVGNIVALCDIDDRHLDSKAKEFPKAAKYHDFRKMLDEMGKTIDAVTVSTPDHTHAVASIMAMKMGKHVYCQKPLTHSVFEARHMREVAREHKVCTQMGNQGTASNGLRTSVEIVQSGVLGDIKEVHVWTNRPVWPQAPDITTRLPAQDIPKHVHWDLFLGPAPERPYNAGYHPFKWRGWWDFGTGALGDMACHTANLPFMALKLGHPVSIQGESGALNSETYPAWAKVVYHFPARGDLPPVKFTWYEGRKDGKLVLPPEDLLMGEKFSGSGSLIVGQKGTLYSRDDYGTTRKLLPVKDFKEFRAPPKVLPRNGRKDDREDDDGMKEEWVRAILARDPKIAFSNFDYAAMLTEAVLLGNVAIRCGGRKLEWDGPGLKISNDKDANAFLHTEYRKGWKL